QGAYNASQANRFPGVNGPPTNLPPSFAAPHLPPFQPGLPSGHPFPQQAPAPNGLFLPPPPFGNAPPGNVMLPPQHPGMNFNPMFMAMNRGPGFPGMNSPGQPARGSSRGRGARGV